MNKRIRTQLMVCGAFLGVFSLQAQENVEQIVIKQKLVERVDTSLMVNMTMDLSRLEVSSGQSVVYTPVIERGDSIVALTPLIVNGRARHILYQRTDRTLTEIRSLKSVDSMKRNRRLIITRVYLLKNGWKSQKCRW